MDRKITQLEKENQVLRARLEVAEEHLRAIRSGEVDALVVQGCEGEQIYTLKGAEHPYRSIVEEMQEGAITVSCDGTILYSNKQFAVMLDIPLKKVIGASIYDFLISSHKKMVVDLLGSHSAAPNRVEVVFAVKRRRPQHVRAYLSFREMQIEDNLIYSGVVTDITGLREEQQNRIRLGAALEQAVESVLLVDLNGRIQYANPATEAILGIDIDRIEGKSLDIIGDCDGRRLTLTIRNALKDRSNWKGRVNGRNKDNSSYHLEVTASHILDEYGKGTCFVVSAYDVTEELQLKKQLRHMQRMEAIGTLAGGIAHDLNNILQPIVLSAEALLLEAENGTETHRMLEKITQAADRQKSLVQQILVFSRREEKNQTVLRVLPLIKEAIKFLRSTLPTTIDIKTNMAAQSDAVLGNPTEIHQVIMNLVSNAADAIGAECGSISVTMENVEADKCEEIDFRSGKYLRLAVSDDGAGIAPDVLNRIFDPFFTTKKERKGTGLGLSVVHGIVQRHGGTITVHSEQGRGTCFQVFFPVNDCADVVVCTDAFVEPQQGRGTVLVVDDEEMIISALQNVLVKLGYETLFASEGKAALEIYRKNSNTIDVVITDQTMPGMTGLELAQKLKKINPSVHIILSTGYQESLTHADIIRAGIKEVLQKPVNIAELQKTLSYVLSC